MANTKKKRSGSGGQRRSKKSGLQKKKSRSSTTARKTRKRARPEIIIRRTSGRKENFDLDRMAQTTGRSGVPFLMARDIAKNVSRKINSDAREALGRKEKTVTAGRVRRMVSEELKKRDRADIASSYSGERPENTRQGRHELVRENQPVTDSESANRSKLQYDSSTHFAKSTRHSSIK